MRNALPTAKEGETMADNPLDELSGDEGYDPVRIPSLAGLPPAGAAGVKRRWGAMYYPDNDGTEEEIIRHLEDDNGTEEGQPGFSDGIESPGRWDPHDAAEDFLRKVGLDPTPDAVGQLAEAFLPALRIMCSRPWDPNGRTWRQAGRLGALADCRKKFMRLWERGWSNGKRHDDSAIDLLNYIGFYLRADAKRWGDWGEPG
jgi:hypothetical protein